MALRQLAHRAIQSVSDDIEELPLQRRGRALLRAGQRYRQAEGRRRGRLFARGEALRILAQLISPFMPHLAEECWEKLGGEGFVATAPWPVADPALAARNTLRCRSR
jgi:leucyl-tRNA synthetase